LVKVDESRIGFVPVLTAHGGGGRSGGPFGGLHFPILCASQPPGAAMVASGTCSGDELLSQVSVPEALVEVGVSEMTIA
jgi:hypothetical protein